ncbi:hypothetical protein [Streptomyces phyllanthi]|uniref:hypothetical protein n=1 Tax=Streptomyces phyllanthi TaxID=1803180 RepID=UPI001883AC45|nr:hypothetical protein [Streptomyces phyllanthi]
MRRIAGFAPWTVLPRGKGHSRCGLHGGAYSGNARCGSGNGDGLALWRETGCGE